MKIILSVGLLSLLSSNLLASAPQCPRTPEWHHGFTFKVTVTKQATRRDVVNVIRTLGLHTSNGWGGYLIYPTRMVGHNLVLFANGSGFNTGYYDPSTDNRPEMQSIMDKVARISGVTVQCDKNHPTSDGDAEEDEQTAADSAGF